MSPMRDKINKTYKTIYDVPLSINFALKLRTIGLKYIAETLSTRNCQTIEKQRNLVAKNNEKSLL